MKLFKRQEMKLLIIVLLFMISVNGCGNASQAEQAADIGDSAVSAETKAEKQETEKQEAEEAAASADDAFEPNYIELTWIEDFYGDKSKYEIYAPKGNSNSDGFLFYYDHGLTFAATVHIYDSNEYLMNILKSSVEYEAETWRNNNSEYTDVQVGKLLENGKDRYQMIKVKTEDSYGVPYEVNYVYYMDIKENGSGVLWHLQLFEMDMDSETDLIIDELAGCYNISLDGMKAAGGWAAASEEIIKAGGVVEALPETILWFNATYAPLTYSNGYNWKVVGGMKPSEYNMEFLKESLSSSWGIEDEDSATETIENLKANGHRAKCRECMEKLEELGILDEEDEEVFAQALLDSGIEENLYRYVIAYLMHRNGEDADYIAAWDLCRVNQLYADFYICGYMTYEEAMDASLENSIILQQMYSSWDDMVSAYLLGYQFWQSDPVATENSPTMRRYQCCLDLLEMEDGPYTLDWNMELQKSW